MAFKIKKDAPKKLVIDLDGPEGNAFVLVGIAKNLARNSHYSKEETDELMQDMKSKSYGDLLVTFDSHFGSIVDFEMSEEYMQNIDSKRFKIRFMKEVIDVE